MLHIGLDTHYRTSTMCILDHNGKKIKHETVRGGRAKLLARLDAIDKPFEICFEASCGYGPLYDELAKRAQRVLMAHPGHLRMIFRSKRKNDRVDAEKIAKLLYLDEVPMAYVPTQDVRQWRELIEFRRRLVDQQTTCKNQIRSLIRSQGWQAPRSLWSRKGLTWLAGQDWPGLSGRVRCDMLLEDLQASKRKIRAVTQALNRIGRHNTGVQLLRTIPGVGPRTAETVVAYIDDPKRFARPSQAAAYFGLVPSQDASAGTNRLGHITKQGPGTARKYLVQAAWQAVRRSEFARLRYERLLDGRRERRKIALVAMAQWLVRCMQSMLSSGEVWRESA
jgi:transposase